MALTTPDYVAKSGVLNAPVEYEWDDENEEDIYLRPDDRLGAKIHGIADRAEVALALGMTEWIVWRLQSFCPDPMPLQYIEAVWVGIIDWRYIAGRPEFDEKNWSGPERGPIRVAIDQLVEVVHLVTTKQFPHPEIVCISRVAEHVLPKGAVFRDWRQKIIARLSKAHPKIAPDFWGEPVLRVALEPSISYPRPDIIPLFSDFLRSLDPAGNPYLQTPERMKALGFEGTPYTI